MQINFLFNRDKTRNFLIIFSSCRKSTFHVSQIYISKNQRHKLIFFIDRVYCCDYFCCFFVSDLTNICLRNLFSSNSLKLFGSLEKKYTSIHEWLEGVTKSLLTLKLLTIINLSQIRQRCWVRIKLPYARINKKRVLASK